MKLHKSIKSCFLLFVFTFFVSALCAFSWHAFPKYWNCNIDFLDVVSKKDKGRILKDLTSYPNSHNHSYIGASKPLEYYKNDKKNIPWNILTVTIKNPIIMKHLTKEILVDVLFGLKSISKEELLDMCDNVLIKWNTFSIFRIENTKNSFNTDASIRIENYKKKLIRACNKPPDFVTLVILYIFGAVLLCIGIFFSGFISLIHLGYNICAIEDYDNTKPCCVPLDYSDVSSDEEDLQQANIKKEKLDKKD